MPLSRHRFNGTGPRRRGCHGRRPPGTQGPQPLPPWCAPAGSNGQHPASVVKETASRTATSHELVPRQTPWTYQWGWSHLADLEGGVAYAMQLEIGTPPQKVKVLLDTGSYELWVNPNCQASNSELLCQSHGFYYPNKSSTATALSRDFQLTYGTGGVRGSYWTDTMNFAVANDSYYAFSGIMGLGYAYPYTINYPSVLNLMVSQKKINAPIFSLGLGGEGDNFAEIIFGGVNRWKFGGPLEPVKIWPSIEDQDPRWIQYWVNITSVGLHMPNKSPVVYTTPNFVMPVLLDTGSALSYFRSDLVAIIAQQFQATVDPAGNYVVDCAWHNAPGTIDFGFNRGKMVINVRFKDFILQTSQSGYCLLGVQPADVGAADYVLGNTFLRGAYLVFDQQSDIVWMNQYYNCGDGVRTVGLTKMDVGAINGACNEPACSTVSSPLPSASKLTQNTAFPSTGRNVNPSSHGASQSTMPSSHHPSPTGASSLGKFVPPPVVPSSTRTYAKKELTRFPPTSGDVYAADVNQSVWKCWSGSRWARGTERPWKERARDSTQRTTGSDGGRLVDCEVRRLLGWVVLWEVVPLRVKVDFLEGVRD
ncbi:aspartic peptidase domain-containing protein [Staphylotrichum tortipilum]|uniref:Aspartic peptidase domain-containing protein n=1 Tax=Staphylotrichum tortipilum TaxID=2831512 RepID=A0AAN6RWZ8_9PEZI|nr:aspartic peptidase domain-containing protein [Staphylotrichum longicolle]